MKRKIVLINLVLALLFLCLPLKAEETILSQEEAQATFLAMEKTFLSRFDKVCIHVELDEIPIIVLALQHDLLHQEAVVIRADLPKSGPEGYFITLHSIMANFEELPRVGKTLRIKSLNLWSEPLFSSPFKIGDFIPSLLLQVRFMQNPDETINGNLQHVMMGFLPIGDGGKYQKLKVYIDATQNLPTGRARKYRMMRWMNGTSNITTSIHNGTTPSLRELKKPNPKSKLYFGLTTKQWESLVSGQN